MPDISLNDLLPLLFGAAGAMIGGLAIALPSLRRSALPAILLFLGPPLLAAAWWQQLAARHANHATDGAPPPDYRIEIREVLTVNVVTDRGRRIRLGTNGRPVPDADLLGVESDMIRTHDLNRKVIVCTGPDSSHNCHGWLFTGGLYWLAGDVVDDILTDNQYSQVSIAAVGDLAVYRGAQAEVVHTGVVRAVDGCTLIESKWGPMSRCIHRPEDQPFGGVCTFYHSDRRGHLLRGLPHEEVQAVGHGGPR